MASSSRSSYNSAWAKRRRLARATALEAEKLEIRGGGDLASSFDDSELNLQCPEVLGNVDLVGHVEGEMSETDYSEFALDDTPVGEESSDNTPDADTDMSMLTETYEFDPDEYIEQFNLENLEEGSEYLPDTQNVCASTALAEWARETNVPHTAVDSLLKCLKQIDPSTLSELPNTARTLMSTNKKPVSTKPLSGMEYTNMGVKSSLLANLKRYTREIRDGVEMLEISLNVDGLPLFQSSKKGVWPVLCQIHLDPPTVFPLSISFGKSKPSNLDFLRENIDELVTILQDGLELDERHLGVKIRAVVCDAPARALVKDVKNHNAYYGCERCELKGTWVRKAGGKGGRVTFQDTAGLTPRTDESFRARSQPQHHLNAELSTPFKDLPIDLVRDFPLDYMHQICLGVMRRLLMAWVRGPIKERKISREGMERLDGRLATLRAHIPKEFARKPRTTDELEHWKATEYRQFLLYTGYQVLCDILAPDVYTNFMALSVACMILVSPDLVAQHNVYAKRLMKYFVESARQIYGAHFLVYNVHMMLHVADDALRFGSLDKCSGFPFENYLHKMKRLVRSGKNPLVQLVNRLNEHTYTEVEKVASEKLPISHKTPDNAYILNNGSCALVTARLNEAGPPENRKAICVLFTEPEPVFVEPCNSKMLDIYQFPRVNRTRNGVTSIILESSIVKKAVMTEQAGSVIFQGILHETQERVAM